MTSEMKDVCDNVVTATANGIYQGIIIAAFVALGLRLLGRTNAATRHAIWFATLVLVGSLIPAHCLRDLFVPAEPGSTDLRQTETVAATPEPFLWSMTPDGEPLGGLIASSSFSSPLSSPSPPLEERAEQRRPSLAGSWAGVETRWDSPATQGKDGYVAGLTESPALVNHDAARPSTGQATRQLGSLNAHGSAASYAAYHAAVNPSEGSRGEKFRWQVRRFLKPASWTLAPGQWVPRLTGMVLLAAWLAVGIIKTSRLFWRFSQIRRLKTEAVAAGGDLESLFHCLRRQLEVARRVQLKISPMQRSSVLLGFLRPVILIPAAQPADSPETEAILRHELAHARRWDDWANLAQQMIQAILFFHPGVWWISRQLSIQREIACDDYVLQQGSRPRAYALLLADLASRIKTCRAPLAPGVTTSKSQLQERIDMILDTHRNTSPCLAKSRLGFITSAAALLAALAFYSAPRLVLAQAPTPSPDAKNVRPISLAAPTAEPAPPALPDAPAPELAPPDRPVPPVPASVQSRPKDKSRDSSDQVPAPTSVAPPAAPAPPGVVMVPPDAVHIPRVVALPRPVAAPHAPVPPFASSPDAALEQRLQRLERMVQSLLEERDPKRASNEPPSREGRPPEVRRERDLLLRQYQDMASRDAARAAERTRRDARKAEDDYRLQRELDAFGKHREQFAKQLEELHKQRQVLEREMEDLQRQIERLEQEQQKMQEDQQRRGDSLGGRPSDAEWRALLDESAAVAK